jgi:hypothetical protein
VHGHDEARGIVSGWAKRANLFIDGKQGSKWGQSIRSLVFRLNGPIRKLNPSNLCY